MKICGLKMDEFVFVVVVVAVEVIIVVFSEEIGSSQKVLVISLKSQSVK